LACFNRLSSVLPLRVPILSAPMAATSGAALACAVSRAGGMGFIAGGYASDRAWIERELRLWKSTADNRAQRIGIGFINWSLTANDLKDNRPADKRPAQRPDSLFEEVLSYHEPARGSPIGALFISFGDGSAYAAKAKAKGIAVVSQCQTLAQALEAAPYSDVLIAQGNESGGHGISGLSTLSLFGLIRQRFAAHTDARVRAMPIVAAGGISNGADMAGFLAMVRHMLSPPLIGRCAAAVSLLPLCSCALRCS
jgi:nitronate monooxygenase